MAKHDDDNRSCQLNPEHDAYCKAEVKMSVLKIGRSTWRTNESSPKVT